MEHDAVYNVIWTGPAGVFHVIRNSTLQVRENKSDSHSNRLEKGGNELNPD